MIGRSNAVSAETKTIKISEQNSQDFVSLKINGISIPQGGSTEVEVGSFVYMELTIGNCIIRTVDGYDVPNTNVANPPPSKSTKAPPMAAPTYMIAPNVDVIITRP